jgi:uncharacterized protein YjbJ (UPF0337 family)
MNDDQLKGKAENIKGRAKDAAGSISGDKRTQGEGFVDRAKGAVREKVGDAKEAIERKRSERPVDETDDE